MERTKEYARVHAHIKRNFGKASKCENLNCNYQNPKRHEWALRKGCNYSTNIPDYIQLCSSCHRKYDFKSDTSLKMSAKRIGKKRVEFTGKNHFKSIPINQFTVNGEFVKKWDSVNQCAINTGIKKQNILENLKGNIKQIKGFTFSKWYNQQNK